VLDFARGAAPPRDATAGRVTFVARHKLAISRFPVLIRVGGPIPSPPSYRLVPANYKVGEAAAVMVRAA
jgi:hypothetical protein